MRACSWRAIVRAVLVCMMPVVATSQSNEAKLTPPDPAMHSINLLPAELRHDRPARDAKEQKAWEDAVFDHYKELVTDYSEYDHRPAIIDTKDKREYRTRLRALAHEHPSFAVNVAVSKIGCGTSCFSVGMEVLSTGQTYLLKYLGSGNVFLRADYRLNSRIMHVMGNLGHESSADRWYLLEPHALKLVYLQPMSSDCFDVGDHPEIWSSAACKFVADTADPEPLIQD